MEKISFKTIDKVLIAGVWFHRENAPQTALLLHMRPATKESWNDFAIKLNAVGVSALEIDLRGHGESVKQDGRSINYEEFPEGSHEECRLDVDAAIDFLQSNGVNKNDIIVVGGSIGANLAIDAMARHPEIKKCVALSPGLEYLGVATESPVKALSGEQKIFIVASEDDTYSYGSAKKLKNLNPMNIELKIFADAGHATRMFEKYPQLMDEIVKWLC